MRRASVVRPSMNSLSDSFGIRDGSASEQRLNVEQVHALEHMFQGHPAIQAARTVISGQLLSGGISLRKNGIDVELQPVFKDHLNEVWIPFAQDVIDSFLKWGFVTISYDEDEVQTSFMQSKRRRESQNDANRKKKLESVAKDPGAKVHFKSDTLIIPIVPTLGSYEIAFYMSGRMGYKRKYVVYSSAPGQSCKEDDESRVVVRQHPDAAGNVNSPLASVFELGSFVGALTELAITAETSRARPRLVTQMRKKDTHSLDGSNLFFDSESRNVQKSADTEESVSQIRALQMQQHMCAIINKLQTVGGDATGQSLSASARGKQPNKNHYTPQEVPPALFHLPKV